MARPRRNDHNRDQLIETGLELLAMQGYHGTGLKQVLDIVKVPKGSFYHYFESKEHFVAEVIRYYSQQLLTQLEQIRVANRNQPTAVLEQIVSQGLALYQQAECSKGCLIGSLAAELGSQNMHCHNAMTTTWHDLDQWLATVIDEAQQAGQITSTLPPVQLSRLFWDSWQGGLLRMQLHGNTEQLNQQMDLMLTQVFGITPQQKGNAA